MEDCTKLSISAKVKLSCKVGKRPHFPRGRLALLKKQNVYARLQRKGYKDGFQQGAEFGYNMGYHDAEEHYMTVIDSQHKLVDESKKEDFKNCMKCTDNTYQYGFKDGYNKANEWHYVKDGDLPKTKGNYLVTWKRVHQEYGEWGFDVVLFNVEEEYFEGIRDPIAWKEIVLPKEEVEK